MEKRGRVGMNDPPLVAATWKKWHLTDFECSRVRITLDTTRFMGVSFDPISVAL